MKSDFPQSAFCFLQRLSAFFNGFPIFLNGFLLSSMAFCFLQRLSDFFNGFPIFLNGFPIFLNGFPLSEKSKKIYLRWQLYERSPIELCISRPLLPKLRNCHSLPKLCNRHLPLSFVIATRSPSFVIATMCASHPTHSCGAPVFPTVHQI